MSQNQGVPGAPSGAASPDEPGTHAAVQQAAGYEPHGQDPSHASVGVTTDADQADLQRVDSAHVGTGHGGEVARRFPDPGLPAHVHRRADTDERAAKRAERQVARLFMLSVVGTLVFVVTYFAFPLHGTGSVATSRLLMGLGLGLAMFSIGAGAVHWAKKLMPDDEVAEERHAIASTQEDRDAAQAVLREGGEATGFPRRKMIWGSLSAAMGVLALPLIVPLRDLWQQSRGEGEPYQQLATTLWKQGTRLLTDPEGAPIKADELAVGTVVHVLPEGIEHASSPNDEKAKAALLVMRLHPEDLHKGKEWSYQGIVAYSEICTHMGCPVALYEQQTHHLLCPCHQSTFDVPNGCKVIFGPAARPLPQLAITVDADGYLVARRGFAEPVGPSFWERG